MASTQADDDSTAAQFQTALDGKVKVGLTHAPLDVLSSLERVKSPEAGAVVMFAGTTRNNFQSRAVLHLEYSAYVPLALKTMLDIAMTIHAAHSLVAIDVIHRLGTVPIGEESILICVSAPHRQAAWRAGEEALEKIKDRVEVWKLERFGEGDGEEEAVWRANRDGAAGEWIERGEDRRDNGRS